MNTEVKETKESNGLYDYLEIICDKTNKTNENIHTYNEIRDELSHKEMTKDIDKAYECYKYFIYNIFPYMIKFYKDRYVDQIDSSINFNSEYNLTNRNGLVVFSLLKTPFSKYYLEEQLSSDEFQEFMEYIKSFVVNYNIGSILENNGFGMYVCFKASLMEVVEIYFLERQRIEYLEASKNEQVLKKRTRTADIK